MIPAKSGCNCLSDFKEDLNVKVYRRQMPSDDNTSPDPLRSGELKTESIQIIYIGSGCSRVVQGAGRKAKRMVLQCNNGVGSNPVEGRTKI